MNTYQLLSPVHSDSEREHRRRMIRQSIANSGTPREREALRYALDEYGWEDIVRYTGIPKTQARMIVLGVLV